MSLLTCNFGETILHIDDYNEKLHKNNITCKACDSKLIARKGDIKIHHYAHAKDSNCLIKHDGDNKTAWHILWQNIAKPEYLEKFMKTETEKHIADVVNEDKLVIEIQHSNISWEDIEARENFYGNMIWILDGTGGLKRDCTYFITANNYGIIQIRTIKFWDNINKKAFIDTGLNMFEIIKKIDKNLYIFKQVEYTDFLQLYILSI